MSRKKKNVSKNVKSGQLLHSKDSYFYGTDGKSKKSRMSVVVDSNKHDDLAIVKLTTAQAGTLIENYRQGKSRYKNDIYTLDNRGQPIRISCKFKVDKTNKKNLSKQQANNIKKNCLQDTKRGAANLKRLKKLKKRGQYK